MDVVKPLASAGAGFGDLEYLGFRLVQELPDVLPGRVERAIGDLVADRRELSHYGSLANDLRVAPDVVRRRRVLRQRAEVSEAAGLVLVGARLDRLRNRDHVGWPALIDQARDVTEDAAVVVAVEIFDRKDVADTVPG